MSEAILATQQPIEALPFEQQIFARSPFGIVTTTVLVFTLLFGTFLVAADIEHVAIVRPGLYPTGASWPALVLSLICCAALAMQRYMRVAEAAGRAGLRHDSKGRNDERCKRCRVWSV